MSLAVPDGSAEGAWARPSVVLGLTTLAFHLLFNGGYGFQRDELYFIVCGERLDWGYVDQPPLVPLIAWLSRSLFGASLTGFRLVPALAMSATVALTAELARLLGGGRFAQWLAGLCVLGSVVFLAFGTYVSTDMFQPLTWLACSWAVVRVVQTGDDRYWLAFGLVVGFSLQSKYLVLFYVLALGVGVVLTPLRASLARPWIWLGAVAALGMAAPNLVWQWRHGWPFLELGAAGVQGKNLPLSPAAFLGQQVLLVGPMALPVWIAGLWSLAIRPRHPSYRVFPVAWFVLCASFVLLHGKATYPAPIYPTLLAAGAVAMEGWLRSRVARGAALGAVAVAGVLLAPMAVPMLPVETYVAYARALGLSPSATAGEKNDLGPLPQHFADMHGWPEMAARVAAVYHALPPEDRGRAVFFGRNYGEAAAIDVLGRPLGLPAAISGHNNYFLWGPRGHDGSVVIVIGGDRERLLEQFERADVAGHLDHPYAMPYETNRPIYVLRGMRAPMSTAWPKVRNFS